MVIFFVACLQQLQTLCLVHKSTIPKFGQVSELRACHPIFLNICRFANRVEPGIERIKKKKKKKEKKKKNNNEEASTAKSELK